MVAEYQKPIAALAAQGCWDMSLLVPRAWPERAGGEAASVDTGDGDARRGHQPGRKSGALVVLVDGALVLYVERGGRTVLSFDEAGDRHCPIDVG